MRGQFIPYNLALNLKKLGFDEKCFGFFQNDKSLTVGLEKADINHFTNKRALKNETYSCVAPLWQQAFDWLRNNKGLYGIVIPTVTGHWTYKTMTVSEDMIEVPSYNHVDAYDYGTYKEAREACLDKLIELYKKD